MQPTIVVDDGSEDLFRSRLLAMIDLRHELVKLAKALDWSVFEDAFGPLYHESQGRPGLRTRLMVGLHLLKHKDAVSDEQICARYLDSPYVQHFCGEAYFQHVLMYRGRKMAGERQLRWLRTRLGRVIMDIQRKIEGNPHLEALFAEPLVRAERIQRQKQGDKDKLYAFHAPEVECLGKGKPRTRYEFGVKVSVTTTNAVAKGGQFVVGMQSLSGHPYDGHSLKAQIEQTARITGINPERVYVDRGYRGHDADNKKTIFISGQKRGLTPTIKRELKRRNAIEPVIGHMKSDGLLDRNHLNGADGDAINALLAAAGHNLRLLARWLIILIRETNAFTAIKACGVAITSQIFLFWRSFNQPKLAA